MAREIPNNYRNIYINVSSGLSLYTNITILNDRTGDEPVEVRRNSATLFRVFTIGNGSTVLIAGLTISGGQLNYQNDTGGGIWNFRATTTLRNCTVKGNTAFHGGGIMNDGRAGAASMTLIGCTISGNTSEDDGGGIYNNANNSGNARLALINCTLSDNTSLGNNGGAIFDYTSEGTATVSVETSTFSANKASNGGAIFNVFGAIETRNCIFKRGASGGNLVNLAGGFASLGHNLSDDVAGGDAGTGPGGILNGAGDQRNTDPKLGPLQDNSGPTLTHALLPDSLAINAGDDAVNLSTDQRGLPRKQGAHVDIGAFEFDAPPGGASLVVNTLDEHNDGVCGTLDCTLLEALDAANNNVNASTVNFKTGLSGVIKNTLATNGLYLRNPITINGPGAGILTLSGNNANRVFYVEPGVSAAISGLTVADGNTIISTAYGAGTYNAGSLTLLNCAVLHNVAPYFGGGIYNEGTLRLTGCTLSGNSASNGGAIFSLGISNLTGCTLSNNTAPNGGGGITNGGTANLTNCTLSDNKAPTGGGGAINTVGTLNLTGCTLNRNSAAGGGGGIYSYTNLNGSTTTLRNSTLSGNSTAREGGGLFNVVGKTVIENCTITNNTATISKGSGAASSGNTQTHTEVRNSLIVVNANTDVDHVNGATNSFVSNGYNRIGNGNATNAFSPPTDHPTDQASVTPAQIKLDPILKNNGGPTFTHALLSGSVAINAGGSAPAVDQRGFSRVGAPDIGAFEFGAQPLTPPVNLSLAPGNSSRVVGVSNTYTSKYADANGIPDIVEARILINSSLNGANALHAMYLLGSNRLYLRDNTNGTWLGGFAPLSNNVITNSQGSLNCALTTVGGSGNTLTINWSFTPASTFTGGKYIYMQVRDKGNLIDGFEQMGTVQMVANSAPVNQSVTPSSGASAAGTARTLTAKSFDTNGSTDIAEARLLVNTAASGVGALMGMYTPANNKLFLRDNANGSWLGGFAPGSANVITNSQGSLNCAATSVTFGAQILTINWSLKPVAAFAGTKNIYLLARDRSNAVDGLEPLGTWTITNTALSAGERAAGAASPVALSSAEARADGQSVTLTFTGALNAAVASDTTHYRVEVNGQAVAVQSVVYASRHNSVSLSVAAGTLQAGHQVVVAWTDLRDSQGATLSGQAGPVTVR